MPTLKGKDADRFLKKMLKKEVSPITKKEKKISEEIRKNFSEGEICSKCGRMRPSSEMITYANSILEYTHGFGERICQNCYIKKEESSPWFNKGVKSERERIISFIETERDKGNYEGGGFSASLCLSKLLKDLKEKVSKDEI